MWAGTHLYETEARWNNIYAYDADFFLSVDFMTHQWVVPHKSEKDVLKEEI